MITEPLLIDAGPLVAIVSENDVRHNECVAVLQTITRPMITCWPVIVEAAYLLRRRPDQVRNILASISRGAIVVDPLTDPRIFPQVQSLYDRYGQSGLQIADACMVALAGSLGIRTIFTVDRRDFGMITPKTAGRSSSFHTDAHQST